MDLLYLPKFVGLLVLGLICLALSPVLLLSQALSLRTAAGKLDNLINDINAFS
jgi:hypothetical protein